MEKEILPSDVRLYLPQYQREEKGQVSDRDVAQGVGGWKKVKMRENMFNMKRVVPGQLCQKAILYLCSRNRIKRGGHSMTNKNVLRCNETTLGALMIMTLNSNSHPDSLTRASVNGFSLLTFNTKDGYDLRRRGLTPISPPTASNSTTSLKWHSQMIILR